MNKRADIIAAVETRLKTITIANGYNIAIGSKVYSWRTTPLPLGGLPAIEVRDGESTMETISLRGSTSHTMKLQISILCSGDTAGTAARSGIEDIAKALFTDPTFGGLVLQLMPAVHRLEYIDAEEKLVAGSYDCTLIYHTAAGQI